MMPLFEAKMIHHFDTRWATYEENGSIRPTNASEKAERMSPVPRYWVAEAEIARKLGSQGEQNWFLGWRDICRATDERTSISTLLPRVAVGNKIPLAFPEGGLASATTLQALWSSFVFDFAARQKVGGITMNFFIFMQLPMPRPDQVRDAQLPLDRPLSDWLGVRVDRLNAWIIDERERARVRAELDAAAFHLYGLDREEVSYVMDTFPIVKRKDEAAFGSFRTKELILAAYNAMTEATVSGQIYRAPWTQEATR